MKKWTQCVAFILVIATVAGMLLQASAANYTGDINSDGKISAFDAQMLAEAHAGHRNLNKNQQAAVGKSTICEILDFIAGKVTNNVGKPVTTIINTIEDLQAIYENPSAAYSLAKDLDLAGADWIPVANFSGTFSGNGNTISNFTINTNCNGNQGFFADTTAESVITDLHLENVTVTASDAQYVGLLTGISCGTIQNCTVSGIISDQRESSAAACMGVFSGSVRAGQIIGGTSVSITDDAAKYTTSGLCAKVAFVTPKIYSTEHHRFVGEMVDGVVISGQWADVSNNSSLLSTAIQGRRNTAVDYMNAMGTVKWIPSESLTFQSATSGTYYKVYEKGKIYTGLPYSHNNASMERTMSVMIGPDENGIYTTQTGLGDTISPADGIYPGFAATMGNNCILSIGWAWMQVSPVLGKVVKNQTNGYHGGVHVRYAKQIIPREDTRNERGIYPVGYWSDYAFYVGNPHANPNDENNRTEYIDAPFDTSRAAYQCTDDTHSAQVLESNGANVILEAYAIAHKADAIVGHSERWNSAGDNGGHARMLVADPIVIRNTDNTIDQIKSYMLTTEQGATFRSSSYSTWLVNQKYSFQELLDVPGSSTFSGYYRTYLPVTIRALQEESVRSSYVTRYTSGTKAVTGPDTGYLYSNYRILSTTVTVRNGSKLIYHGEVFTGISESQGTAVGPFNSPSLEDHAEAFAAAAKAAGLPSGTYQFSVQATPSDGKMHSVVTYQNFTYTAP